MSSENLRAQHTDSGSLASLDLTTDAGKRALMLYYVPSDGTRVGNKWLQNELSQCILGFSREEYFTIRDRLVFDGILMKDRGRGGSVRLAGTGLNSYEAKSKHRIKKYSQIQAVRIRYKNDPNPEWLGRGFLDWTEDKFKRVASGVYGEVSSRHRRGVGDAYLACSICHQPVTITGIKGSHDRTMKHRSDADGYCRIKGKNTRSKNSVYAEIYKGGEESEEHEAIIKIICDGLEKMYDIFFDDEIENINSNLGNREVMLGFPKLNRALRSQDGERYKRPDIQFTLLSKDGKKVRWAIEVQCSKILGDDIRDRSEYYRNEGVNIIWVSAGNLAKHPTSNSAMIFQDMHRGCQIFLDVRALEAMSTTGALHFSLRSYTMELDDDGAPFIETYDLIRFPDGFKVENGIVFGRDIDGDTVEDKSRERRNKVYKIMKLVSENYWNKDIIASANKEISTVFHSILNEMEDAPDFEHLTINSTAWRTISVIMSMIVRMKKINPSFNLTRSRYPIDPLIFSFNPLENLYVSIIKEFIVCSGYEEFYRKYINKDGTNINSKLSAIEQFESLNSSEKRLFQVFLGEIFCPVIRTKLKQVNRLPFWALKSPIME